jgi:predicted TIM-barrel fold metal-dependent hydrolase
MIDSMVVVDAVVHPWNMAPENLNPQAPDVIAAVHASHRLSVDAAHHEYILEDREFFTDLSWDVVAQAEFVETPVDLGVMHALPNLGFGRSYITDPERSAAFRDCHPQRFRFYGTVDTPKTDAAIAQLEHQVKALKADGLKLYPAFFYDNIGEGWKMDGAEFARPLLEAARDLGLRHVAIHKALWLPPAPREAFAIDDLDSPLDRFPGIQFEMVHGGAAFLDETIALLKRHRNLWLTLETTFQYILVKPRVFAKILGRIIAEVGSDRLLFASGNNLGHPAPLLEAFRHYQFPDELIEEFGLRPLTGKDRANILGGNALRLHGLTAAAVIAATADDPFARQRAAGVPAPWHRLRAH